MSSTVLQDDEDSPVVVIDGTVRRRSAWWTPSVHHLLEHLADVGFSHAPRPLGFDHEGREMLSFVPGESGREAAKRIATPGALASFAALLRRFHDSVVDYESPIDADWALPAAADAPSTGICHGDFTPWNVVWSGDAAMGIVDFDLAHRAPASHDVAYALAWSVPFRDDAATCSMLGVDAVPDRRHRIQVFADAYGVDADGLVDLVVERQHKYALDVEILRRRGFVARWTSDRSIERNHQIAGWLAGHVHLFR